MLLCTYAQHHPNTNNCIGRGERGDAIIVALDNMTGQKSHNISKILNPFLAAIVA